MKQYLLGLLTAACLSGMVAAQDIRPPLRAVQDTINGQIAAFLKDDFAAAFGFASPSIQSMFRTPENFGAMVRNGYPMVWRPGSVQFGDLREQSGMLWQEVIVTDARGQLHALEYQMVELDGQWRIAGVRLLPAPDLSA